MSVTVQFQHDIILREALTRFEQHNWNIGSRLQSMVQLEKPKCMSRRTAMILMLTLNIIGIAIVVSNKLRSEKERVTLLARPDGQLQVLAKWTQLVTDNPEEVEAIAASPIEDLSWVTILMIGLLSFALHFAISAAIL